MKKLFLIPLLLLSLASCIRKGDKTPLGWCVWEIQKHEGYEGCYYTYQEPSPHYYKFESKNNVDSYIITTYTEELRTEWFCFIEYSKTIKKYLSPEDVYLIDCDVVWEINLETGEINGEQIL